MREIIKEVRVKGREITLSYRIPRAPKNPSGEGSEEFFTPVANGGGGGNRIFTVSTGAF